jgi:hypothetical protein
MCNLRQLDNKEYLAMAEILEVQREAEQLFGMDWYNPTCYLSKTGIDIKYSTGIIEWFNNKLPMCNPCQLDDKEYLTMAEILEVQCKAEQLFGMD